MEYKDYFCAACGGAYLNKDPDRECEDCAEQLKGLLPNSG